MKTDHYLYRLFSTLPDTLFELTGMPPPSAHYTWHSEEIKQISFRLDGVLTPDDSDNAPLIFVENQFYPEDLFYARYFASIFLYLYQKEIKSPWMAVVVFPERKCDTGNMNAYSGLECAGLLHRVYLEDLLKPESTETIAHASFGVRILKLLMHPTQTVGAEALALLQTFKPTHNLNRIDAIDLIEALLVYKFPKLSREDIRTMLNLPNTELKKTRFYQDVYQEGHSEGRGEGRSEGLESEVKLILRLLARRVGTVSEPDQLRIRTLSFAQIEDLGDVLLDFTQPEELTNWLDSYLNPTLH
jgi:predicted transposase/invertase (TIGR01784 family)